MNDNRAGEGPVLSDQLGGDADPKCDKCGAPITTGMMAAFCPKREGCEFWPHDACEETLRFLDWIGGRVDSPDLPPNVGGEAHATC